MDNPIASVDAVELIDSNIIDASKQSDVAIKRDVMEHNRNYLCKSYPDCNVTTIRQRITYLENKNKILNKPQNGKNSYYSTDDSVVIPDDSASPDNPQSIPLFYPETPKPYKRTGYSNSRPKRKTNCGIKSKKYHFTLRF